MSAEVRLLAVVLGVVAIVGCTKSEPPDTATAVVQRDFVALDRELMNLLLAGDFDRLETALSAVLLEHEADPGKERQVEVAFDTFYRANADLEEPLTKWIQAKPKSYSAHLARAAYYTSVAWERRQGGYARLTSDVQFAEMRRYFAKAASDLAVARRLNPAAVQPIVYQMEGIINDGDRDAMQQLYEEALRIDPTSVAARWQYLWSLLQRWGGTIEQMEGVVEGARRYQERNPSLRILEGRVAAEGGSQALLDRNCDAAKPHLDEALKAGDHWYYLHEAAMWDYVCAGRIADVVPKLRRAIAHRPNAVNVYQTAFLMGHSLYGLGHYAEAIGFLDVQLTIKPQDHKSRQLRGDSYFRLGRMDRALQDFSEIVRLAPDNQEYAADLHLVKTLIDEELCTRDPGNPDGAWVCKKG